MNMHAVLPLLAGLGAGLWLAGALLLAYVLHDEFW